NYYHRTQRSRTSRHHRVGPWLDSCQTSQRASDVRSFLGSTQRAQKLSNRIFVLFVYLLFSGIVAALTVPRKLFIHDSLLVMRDIRRSSPIMKNRTTSKWTICLAVVALALTMVA